MVGESDIPLTKNVIREPDRAFSATFMEWVADGNAEQIIKRGTSAGVFYTVPENFTLFITSAFVSGHKTNAGGAGHFVNLSIENLSGANPSVIMSLDLGNVAQVTWGSVSNSFPMPLRAEAGKLITITFIPNVEGTAGFQGFLLPKKISIR